MIRNFHGDGTKLLDLPRVDLLIELGYLEAHSIVRDSQMANH